MLFWQVLEYLFHVLSVFLQPQVGVELIESLSYFVDVIEFVVHASCLSSLFRCVLRNYGNCEALRKGPKQSPSSEGSGNQEIAASPPAPRNIHD